MDIFLVVALVFSAIFFKELSNLADHLYNVKFAHKGWGFRVLVKSPIMVLAWMPLMLSVHARVDYEVERKLAKQNQTKVEVPVPVAEKSDEDKETESALQLLIMTLAAG